MGAVVEKLKMKEERREHCHHHEHSHQHHEHAEHHGRDSFPHHWGHFRRHFGRRFGGLDESVIKVLEQVPEKARELPTEAKLDFLDAHHIGVSRAQNQTVLAAHNGRLKRTIIALMVPQ